jgi:hypothetical protein
MADASIRYLHPWTTQDIPVARVLDGASACTSALVLGELEDGTFYCAATTSDSQVLIYWLEYFKHRLLCGECG